MADRQRNLTYFLKQSFLWAGLSCGIILLASMAIFQEDIRTHRLRYQLVALDDAGSADQLQRAAGVMRRRFNALRETFGLRDTTVRAGSDNLLHIRFSTRASVREVLFWLTRPGRVQLSLLHPETPNIGDGPVEDPPEGYSPRVYTKYMYRLSRPGDLKAEEHRYLVCDRPVMEVSRFERVKFAKVGLHSRTELTFHFLPREAERFRNVTALNVGRKMVMLVDGRLFFPPKQIGGAIEGGTVQVQGYFYNPPLRKLVKVLNAGPLPGRLQRVSHRLR